MIELPPGMHALATAPLFDWSQYVIHDGTANVARTPDGLTISSSAPPCSYVIACPRRNPTDAAPVNRFAWHLRVDVTLHAGNATLACLAADMTRITDETTLPIGSSQVDLVVGDLDDAAWLVVRRGRVADGPMSVSVRSIECFAIVDDGGANALGPPIGDVRPIRRWSRFYGLPDDDVSARLRYVAFTRLREPRYMPWFEDLEVLISPREQMSQAVFVSGVYEPCTTLVLRRVCSEGATFIDVGANTGWFSLLASRWVGRRGRVLSLEPSQRECDRLRQQVRHNRLDNILVLRVAAGDENGEAELHIAEERYSGLNTIKSSFMYSDVAESHRERVRVVTLDHVVQQQHVSKVDVIKIDVEGAEYEVLMGARAVLHRDHPVVILEVAGPTATPGHQGRQSMERLLRDAGYRFLAIDADRAEIRPVDDLTGAMENFVAAMPSTVDMVMASPLAHAGR